MLRRIGVYGLVAGLIVGAATFGIPVEVREHLPDGVAMAIGYLTMLIALSTIFVAIKRQRDRDNGGVIKFLPALGLGLGISVIAGIFYVLAWEAAMAITHMDFAAGYAKAMIAQEKAKGVSGPALAKVVAEMAQFRKDYANPLYRLPQTFAEIFPVGVLVSLISAGLLRNSRFLPAKRG